MLCRAIGAEHSIIAGLEFVVYERPWPVVLFDWFLGPA